MGFIVAFGVLLDTIVVRSLLVPSLADDVGRVIWWPSRLAREEDHADAETDRMLHPRTAEAVAPSRSVVPAGEWRAVLVDRAERRSRRWRREPGAARAAVEVAVDRLLAGSEVWLLADATADEGGGEVGWAWVRPEAGDLRVLDLELTEVALAPWLRAEVFEAARRPATPASRPPRRRTEPARLALVADPAFATMASQLLLDLDRPDPEEVSARSRVELLAMTDADLAAYLEGEVVAYAEERHAAGSRWRRVRISREQHAELLPDGLASPGQHLFTAWSEGRRVGTLWIGTERTVAFVYDVAVDADRRGEGLGAALMRVAASWARDRGAPALGLNVFGHNRVARALYDKLGYQLVEEHVRAELEPRGSPVTHPSAEHGRLAESPGDRDPWRLWGPYVSGRQWGTVREDYPPTATPGRRSPSTTPTSGPTAGGGRPGRRLRPVRLGNLALAVWNGQDDRLKERYFGLANEQGNHGEDVKEYWWHVDATPPTPTPSGSTATRRRPTPTGPWSRRTPGGGAATRVRARRHRGPRRGPLLRRAGRARQGLARGPVRAHLGDQPRPRPGAAGPRSPAVVPQHLALGARRPDAGPGARRAGRRHRARRGRRAPGRARPLRWLPTATRSCCSATTRPTRWPCTPRRPTPRRTRRTRWTARSSMGTVRWSTRPRRGRRSASATTSRPSHPARR
ncbi:MAG: GNAT family N-acetyltransferase [Nocardioides sp.]